MKKLINIPNNDLRKYGYGILDNKIKYVLVNDDKIDESSVCVSVKTGSINDPLEYQGLAHFLEHMLFLGSKKYPKEDYFDSELKANGGYSNAWTDNFETVYYFSVQNNNVLARIVIQLHVEFLGFHQNLLKPLKAAWPRSLFLHLHIMPSIYVRYPVW